MRINFVYMRPTPVLYFGAVGPYDDTVSRAWDTMLSWLDAHDLRRATPRGFGIIHDHSGVTAPPLQRYDACIELLPGFSADASLGSGVRHRDAVLVLAGGPGGEVGPLRSGDERVRRKRADTP